jgi:hypothetical protein
MAILQEWKEETGKGWLESTDKTYLEKSSGHSERSPVVAGRNEESMLLQYHG